MSRTAMDTTSPVRAYLGLGSNLGDRAAYLRQAIDALGRLPGTRVVRLSSLYETRPWGLAEQPDYYNLVVEIETSLAAEELLRHALAIEAALGRVRTVRFGPRTIDIDVLLYGDQTHDTPELTVPHPRMLQRAFVLVPLAEIAPGVVVAGRTVRQHLEALGDVSADVRLIGRL